MGSLTQSKIRSNQNINIKRQSFYLMPNADDTNLDEKPSFFPYSEDAVVFLRDLNAISQEQNVLENNEASSSKDPRKQEFGSFSPLSVTMPLYTKPRDLDSLPVEDRFLRQFFAGFYAKPTTRTIKSGSTPLSTTQFQFVGDETSNFKQGMAIYVGAGNTSIRHIQSISFDGSDTLITLNAPLPETPAEGDSVEGSPATYFFDDTFPIPLFSFIAQADVVADLVTGMFVQGWTLEAGNDGYLTHSFEAGGVRVLSAVHSNFMKRHDPDTFDGYSDINALFETSGTITVKTQTLTGGTSIPIDNGTGDLDTATIPAGLVVEINHTVGGIKQYITKAGGTVGVLELDEPLQADAEIDDAITVRGVANWQFVDQPGGVIQVKTAASIGDTEIEIENVLSADLANAPTKNTPVFVGGRQYFVEDSSNNSVNKVVLSTPLVSNLSPGDPLSFATRAKVAFTDSSRLDEFITYFNSDSGDSANSIDPEIFQNADGGGRVEVGGKVTLVNWDVESSPNTIANVWRGFAGTLLQGISDYDNTDLYFPTPNIGVPGNLVQARKDVVTLIGDESIRTKSVSVGANKNAEADTETRNLSDYADLPEDDVREYTLTVEANMKPSHFKFRFGARMNNPESFQTTVGGIKGRRLSIYAPKVTLSDLPKEAGDLKMTTTVTMNVFQSDEDEGKPAIYLSYC